ncbi:MAG: flavin reductase family protein [Thaumarchaeota archaeon]|nr:flavin reductase family protein [Nitrososphaerota archaeon]
MKPAKIPRLAVPPEFVYRLFYPQIPIVVTAAFHAAVAAMPAVSCISISNDPPTIAAAVGKSLRTNRILKRAKTFGISWFHFKDRKILELLSVSGKKGNKLKELRVPYRTLFGTPIPRSSMAYVICKKKNVIDVGDHDLFVGHVIGAMASTDFDEYWMFSDYRPVLYRGSAFRAPFTTIKQKSV